MAIEDLLARLKIEQGHLVTPATPRNIRGVTTKAAPALAATRVTPATPQNGKVETGRTKLEPIPVTFEYFRAWGVNLLPDDLAFLRWHMPRDTALRNAWIEHYFATWQQAMNQEPKEHRKQNAGRRMANTWLREKVTTKGEGKS